MRKRSFRLRLLSTLMLVCGATAAPVPAADTANLVRVETPLGSFEIELFTDDAPVTVANFRKYISSGRFRNSFIHRSMPGFVLQGGGHTYEGNASNPIPTYPPIVNEFKRSNVRGTIAMAKADGDPNSATSQWFINLVDNSATLDSQNGGFTVFGQVVGNGMAVVDALAAVPVYNFGGVFANLPLRDFTGQLMASNLLFTQFTDLSSTSITPPLLLRNSTSGSWYSYRLGPDGKGVGINEQGKVKLPRDGDLRVVSRGDFDGDDEPDVLMRDDGDGSWTLALLVGKKIISKSAVSLPTTATLEVVATADFNGDGEDDVLLRDSATGRWQVWLLDGARIVAGGEVALGPDELIGVGDLDGDGDDDVLLRSSKGVWTTGHVDGPGVQKTSRPKLPKSAKTVPMALADLDGDGTADLLTRTTAGKWQAWLFGAGVVRSKGTVSMPRSRDTSLAATADFNGDGATDALLRDADGGWLLYTLQGRKVLGSGPLAMTEDAGYTVVVTDDVNHDGMADVLLRDVGGAWLLYTIDGSGPEVTSTTVPKLNTNTAWVPQLD